IKIVYPSNGADLKGLIKAAYHDPNPVVILEHKGLYWSKVKGTEAARTTLPAEDYILPLGKAAITQAIEEKSDKSCLSVITYGMGVHWALNASSEMRDRIEIIDLRTLYPLDEASIFNSVRKTGKCLIVTEEPVNNSFARSLAGLVQENCFEQLDGPVRVIGSENMPAIPLNSTLEQTMIPNSEKVKDAIISLLEY
ncbi:MAG: tungsten formylmethanofuran dehydrogenase, partial [Bacteroidetes bacterium]|nr:tungsten formylmethanofuran dehydrogenase [Bacteroidota bacterium]